MHAESLAVRSGWPALVLAQGNPQSDCHFANCFRRSAHEICDLFRRLRLRREFQHTALLLERTATAFQFSRHLMTFQPSPSARPPNIAGPGLSLTGAFNIETEPFTFPDVV